MRILHKVKAGSEAKSDIYIEIAPGADGVVVNLRSTVMELFGKNIETSIRETLKSFGIENAVVSASDYGALDFTIRARIETALMRASE